MSLAPDDDAVADYGENAFARVGFARRVGGGMSVGARSPGAVRQVLPDKEQGKVWNE